jgi:ribosomal protein S12 methylthiotransferase accessory factor
MKIDITMLDGQQLKASFGKYEIISDQSSAAGGKEEYPEPFDYFLASMPLCAAFYIRKFCESRNISTDGIKISQENITIDPDNKYKKKLIVSVELPASFPEKYKKALLAAANTCTVKKVIQAAPEFEVKVV